MSQEEKQRAYFILNDFFFSLYQNKKINLTKYMDTLQLIAKYSKCEARLGDIRFFNYNIMIKCVFNLGGR